MNYGDYSKMGKSKTPMTTDAARRIQIAEAKKSGGNIAKDGFAATAMRTAAKNTKQGDK
jgi:hypothetical protein